MSDRHEPGTLIGIVRNPQDTPLSPITAKERRRIAKSIKKKYDGFRRTYPEVHGKVVDFITHSI